MLENIKFAPSLGVLRSELLQRCKGIALSLPEGEHNVSAEAIAALRSQFMRGLERPRKEELAEELHLLASISVLIDLIGQGWRFASLEPEIILAFERSGIHSVEKERIRSAHLLDRDSQLHEASVVSFIKGMEKRRLTPHGWHSIFSLMRDGEILSSELRAIRESGLADSDALRSCVSPYLQFVTSDAVCEYTGLRLNDIWRYFRHTWVNSYRSVPGRSMMVLVRDSAGPNHPVIAIAALGSSVVQSSVRDRWIGWDTEGTLRHLQAMKPRRGIKWVLDKSHVLISAIYTRDLVRDSIVTATELRKPTDAVLKRLDAESEKSIKRHRLYPLSAKHGEGEPLTREGWRKRAETPLFRSKRAKQLSKLLKVKMLIEDLGLREGILASEWQAILDSSAMRLVIGQLIRSIKAERVGINMMDITVCGAIAPYNHLLGGKLICMLLCSPELSVEFARRYGEHVSIIASAMQGAAVKRRAKLALLCTTSLYGSSLSQYSRIRIPAKVVGGKSDRQIEFKTLGVSEGFGSFHFSKQTLKLFGMVLGRAQHARKVNSIFGEGVNPLMRKIRDAMGLLGLPAEQLLRHGNRRVVYGVSLVENLGEFLGGFDEEAKYSLPHTKVKARSAGIAAFWSERWLSKRLDKAGLLEQVAEHRLTYPIRHGARVDYTEDQYEMEEFLSS